MRKKTNLTSPCTSSFASSLRVSSFSCQLSRCPFASSFVSPFALSFASSFVSSFALSFAVPCCYSLPSGSGSWTMKMMADSGATWWSDVWDMWLWLMWLQKSAIIFIVQPLPRWQTTATEGQRKGRHEGQREGWHEGLWHEGWRKGMMRRKTRWTTRRTTWRTTTWMGMCQVRFLFHLHQTN